MSTSTEDSLKAIGPYQIMRRRGRDAAGETFDAVKESRQRVVLVKLLHSALTEDEESLARFEDEVERLSELEHDNVLRVTITEGRATGRSS